MPKIQELLYLSLFLIPSACAIAPASSVPVVKAPQDTQGYVELDRDSYQGNVVFHIPKGSKLVGVAKKNGSNLGALRDGLFNRFFKKGTQRDLWIWFDEKGVRASFDGESYPFKIDNEDDRFKVLAKAYGLAPDSDRE